ncbi:glycoside hydrolase family 5 protein [Collinsella vaginalis]|uniref:glycoside hydrolase family 5 protein n=1 Tax=Collinsella vaginalis TaxID=1870987 RepID=UPI000A270867|nr:cellulase family glycosylhydrolase [Collinsella vaginalis]
MPLGFNVPLARSRRSSTDALGRVRGVNLAGWFIPEPWVTPSLFAATGASNDTELQQALGASAYCERMRHHYETFVSEDDFRRMAAIGLNAVRLPVPWYAFGSQSADACHVTVVDYIDRAMEWGEKHGVSVLLDLATVPGGQGDSNEPVPMPDLIAEWHSSTNGRHAALEVLERLATRYGSSDILSGIELLDSPVMSVRRGLFSVTDGIPIHYLRNFYRDAYELVRTHMPVSKAVVFSASGHPDLWRGFMRGARYENVLIDLHLYHYRDETAQDITSPRGIRDAIARARHEIRAARAAGFPVIVGEWSGAAVLSSASITPEGRAAYERVFVANQLAAFEGAQGWYFQTWKTEKRLPAWDARVALGTLERAMIE